MLFRSDGTATRDFCPVYNVVLANLLAALTDAPDATGGVFNVACGKSVTLNELLSLIAANFAPDRTVQPVHEPAREGDIRHSSSSIERAARILGYRPLQFLEDGLRALAAQTSD